MKQVPSKLDAHTEKLDSWLRNQADGGEGLTLRACVEKLAEIGVRSSIQGVSKWWRNREARLAEQSFLERVASGAETARKVRRAFGKQPPPQIEELLAIHRQLIFDLSVTETVQPKMLELAERLTRTVVTYAKLEDSRQRTALDQRRVVILEARAALADQTEGAVNDAALTPEQRAQRIAEIYGRA